MTRRRTSLGMEETDMESPKSFATTVTVAKSTADMRHTRKTV
jgi:hypothetical protein